MKIRKNDTVYIRSGKDKGKTGKVLRAFPKTEQILVEGVNIKKTHRRARRSESKGEIIEKSHPIAASTASLVDPKSKKPTRVKWEMVGEKKMRISKKSGATIE